MTAFSMSTYLTTGQERGMMVEVAQSMSKRTTHGRTGKGRTGKGVDVGFGPRPYIEVLEASRTVPGRGAETNDREDRERWPTRKPYKSAYSHLINLPDFVAAGDRNMAAILRGRIEVVMARGGWTTNEWNRLHKMYVVWSQRAEGKDLGFNLRGWSRQGTGHHTPSIEKTLRNIRREIECLGRTKLVPGR